MHEITKLTDRSDHIQSCPFSTNEAPHADLTRRTQAPQAKQESGFQLLVSGHKRRKAEFLTVIRGWYV